MTYKKMFAWLTLDIIIFIVINALIIGFFGQSMYGVFQIDLFKLLVLGLAGYRLANIISVEAVAKPVRAPVVDDVRRDTKVVEKPKSFEWFTSYASYIGVWVAMVVVYAYVFWPSPTLIISFILALSAVERIIGSIVGFFRQRV